MAKRFLALARVSSREQEREGFSLEVQVETLTRYATEHDGEIFKLFRIAETATKPDERRTFKELLGYAKDHAAEIDAVLFFKVDRAARNLFDYVELERLEDEHGVKVVYVTQPTENTPAGRMMRRTLANMASFYTEQQSLDVRDGLERRVKSGLFVGKAPFGYRNVRHDGRSLVEVDPRAAAAVRRAFDLYAFHGHTIDSLLDQLDAEGVVYTAKCRRFTRSKLHTMLRDRAYLGEVAYRGHWHEGTHEPLIDRATFDRVQQLLGGQIYRSHELTYAGHLIMCGHCGRPITGESIERKRKSGVSVYRYYRCAGYTAKGHPRIRLTEADLDAQVMGLFDRLKIEDEQVRDWFARVLRERTRGQQDANRERQAELSRQVTLLRRQQDQLLNLRLLEEIDADTYAAKSTELRDQVSRLSVELEATDRGRAELGEIAIKAFELSQVLREKWLTADYRAKRHLLEIVGLNYRLDDVTLVPEWRKPFDVLAEGPLSEESRGDTIRTCDLLVPNQPRYQAAPRPALQAWG